MGTTMSLDSRTWEILGPLAGADAAGFGQMLEVTDGSGAPAVAKRIKKQPGADRELLLADLPQGVKNVVPVLDKGEHEDDLVLVMPRAQMSLQQHLRGGALEIAEVVEILTDIATALVSLDGKIVHRDLKPANVLLFDGHWCLADFGISRYADASTAPDTRKFSWSPQYAAPEQWMHETATSKTDIYAFGGLAYLLVSGEPPFTGSIEDLRDAHVHDVPKPVGPSRLRSIIEECLYKAPEARPSAANVLARLAQVNVEPKLSGANALARVTETVRAKNAAAYAEQRANADEATRRAQLLTVANQSYRSMLEPLLEAVLDGVGSAGTVHEDPSAQVLFEAQIANARLTATMPHRAENWNGPFDVIAAASVTVHRLQPSRMGWSGRSHALWYCDAHTAGQLAWYELAFMASAFIPQPTVVPYQLPPESAGIAFSNVMGSEQLAWPVTALDRDDISQFVDRWIGWLAAAAEGTLDMPSSLPERSPAGSWRRRDQTTIR